LRQVYRTAGTLVPYEFRVTAVVHVIDDDELFRSATGRLLEAVGYRVFLHESATQFLLRLRVEEHCCILLDVHMPGLSGPELQDRLAKDAPFIPIVFLSGRGDIQTSVKAIKSGAEDFLTKPVSREHLVEAIERALAKARSRLEQWYRFEKLQELVSSLTRRERQVFELVVQGKMNKQIAFDLGTSERTIKAHRKSVMEKLNATSIAGLVSMAERLGIFDKVESTSEPESASLGREPRSAKE
jgi:FixJ family two-component response regulator